MLALDHSALAGVHLPELRVPAVPVVVVAGGHGAAVVAVAAGLVMMPRSTSQAALEAFQSTRNRPAVRLVEAATRAAEETPATARIPRRIPQPTYSVSAGGCRDCGHLPRVHESGYDGRRVPCKSIDCTCQRYRGRRIDWETVLIVLALLVGTVPILLAAWAAMP